MMIGGMFQAIVLPLAECVVPTDVEISGPVAVWVTSDSQPLLSSVVDRSPTKTVAGPLMAFIDSLAPQALPQLIVSGGAVGGGGAGAGGEAPTTSVTTVSPEQATSILESAQAQPTATDGATATSSGAAASPTDAAGAGNNLGGTPPGSNEDGSITVVGWSEGPAAAR